MLKKLIEEAVETAFKDAGYSCIVTMKEDVIGPKGLKKRAAEEVLKRLNELNDTELLKEIIEIMKIKPQVNFIRYEKEEE
ncbi:MULTISPECIES: hypothetical protein [unclassified Bacillus cereus group]|uniref:hypothetical protein n=1 Tax=unclassified Bacillus cereus group TaxID=2750818 RepID=UPI0029C5BB63|nr:MULTISPECIES: hypothetical protein [unclassified Bacillus cereus group]MDX5880817.1 hypothetical protein [Bacillus cereus group sp. BfR-BA-01042]MDX5906667.1 hypothetical protein [Bacillus cereus group sp. BfR-BA-01048]